VGKSTLFNKLVGQRLSIVDDKPGVTRDRIYSRCEWLGKEFMLIDTGGIEPKTDDVILAQMREQAMLAVERADAIIFVTDITTGVTANDSDVASMLIKSGKPVVLAVNKVDGIGTPPPEIYEFYNLGLGDPIPVSSVHGHGTGDLLEAVFENLPPEEPESLRNRSALNADRLQRALPGWSRVSQYLSSRGFYLYQNTKAVYLPEGALLLEDILGRIKAAERFIFMEYFILAEGKLWDRMSAALCERARSGVEVKIIFDDFGNIKRFSAESLQTLRDAGVEVIVFNPVHEYVNRLYFNYRDHRKITVIDGETAYTGGVNIADEYANLIDRFGYWKDSGIRLEGEGVWGLTAAFLNMWSFLGGALHEERDYYRPHTSPASDGFCQSFLDGPQNNPDNPAEDTFLQLITNARRFLYITTPYFIPDESIMRALCIAGDGGVDVRLMLPGTPDHWYADAVADSYIGELLEHHVKVYRYTPGFLHAKSIMVDREAAFVGSVNFDYRSFELHYECGVMLYGASAIESLLEDMDGILDKSHAVTPEEWAHRGLLRRMFEPILRVFSIWM